MSSPKVAIIIYSMFGHIAKSMGLVLTRFGLTPDRHDHLVAESVKQGIVEAGGSANIYQVKETLPDEVLTKMHAPPKQAYPVITPSELPEFDAYVFGIPTRYGNFPAQWKTFWDATGGLWVKGSLAGKFAGVFVSTGTPGGGQETTVISSLSTLTHHGICFVPLGYSRTSDILNNVNEVRGGSPWGAGTFAGPGGSRQPSALELELARLQGLKFWETVSKFKF